MKGLQIRAQSTGETESQRERKERENVVQRRAGYQITLERGAVKMEWGKITINSEPPFVTFQGAQESILCLEESIPRIDSWAP